MVEPYLKLEKIFQKPIQLFEMEEWDPNLIDPINPNTTRDPALAIEVAPTPKAARPSCKLVIPLTNLATNFTCKLEVGGQFE